MMPKFSKENIELCPLCSSADFLTEIESRDFESGTGRYRVERCRECGMRFTNPRPVPDLLYDLYRTRESSDYVRRYGITGKIRALTIRRWISKVRTHSGPCGSVLDYGCGDGFFSVQLSRCSDFGDITAVDLHDQAPAYLQRQEVVRYRSFGQLKHNKERYQLICCRHVIEHMLDPAGVLKEWELLLEPEGTLVVEVPNYNSVWRKLFGQYYFGLYLPRHLLHFEENTIRNLFRKYHLVRLYRNHTPVLGRSLGFVFGVPLSNLDLVGLSLFPLQVLVDRIARSSSVLSLVLRKQAN